MHTENTYSDIFIRKIIDIYYIYGKEIAQAQAFY